MLRRKDSKGFPRAHLFFQIMERDGCGQSSGKRSPLLTAPLRKNKKKERYDLRK